MPYPPEHKEETRQRILGIAARLFNRKGFTNVTIEEIMTEAGLTHGGFYRHFGGKDELYAEAVRQFLHKEVKEGWQLKHAKPCESNQPFAKFVVDAYLSRDHLEDVGGSCPLIGLSSDVARSGQPVKAAYREVAESMIRVFQANLDGGAAREHALVLLALCVGGMVLARAIDDDSLADELRHAARTHALMTTGWGDDRKVSPRPTTDHNESSRSG
jgi:TetR/AcrR family transcriptional regulator, transcriptional repressor for nem operon